MNDNLESLKDFVKIAERNRKYPANTASGIRAAIRIFEPELNEQEKESLSTLREHLQQIYQNVYLHNKDKMSAGTIDTYRKRLSGAMTDYEKYGKDPTKLASWNRTVRIVKRTKPSTSPQKEAVDDTERASSEVIPGSTITRFELPLRQGVKAIILTPSDMTKEEVKKIKAYIEYLENTIS